MMQHKIFAVYIRNEKFKQMYHKAVSCNAEFSVFCGKPIIAFFSLTLADIMEYFVLFLEWIDMRASIQIVIFSQLVMFHSIEWEEMVSFPHPLPMWCRIEYPMLQRECTLAVLQPGTFCKCLLVFGRAAAQTSPPSTWDFSAPGADLSTSTEPHEVFPGPVLGLSSVFLVEDGIWHAISSS